MFTVVFRIHFVLKSLNSTERIGKETFIRILSKEKKNIEDLAKHLGYQSQELTDLLNLLPEHKEIIPNSIITESDDDEDYQVTY